MPGMFDDLIPTGGGGGMFDDLIPKDAGIKMGPPNPNVEPEGMAGVFRSIGSGLKGAYNRFMEGGQGFQPTGSPLWDIGAAGINLGAQGLEAGFAGAGAGAEQFAREAQLPRPEQFGRDIAGMAQMETYGQGPAGMGAVGESGHALGQTINRARAELPVGNQPFPGTVPAPRPSTPTSRVLDRAVAEQAGATPRASPAAAETVPEAEPRDGNVRLLNPGVPHDLPPRGRASVGAAGTEQSPLAGYSPQTIQTMRDILSENGLDNPHQLEARLDEMSPHHMFAELAPGVEGETAKLHAEDKGEARNLITRTALERRDEAPQREAATFDRIFGPATNSAELTKAIKTEQERRSSPLWKQFEQVQIPPTPELQALMPRLEAAGALRAANKAMAEEGLPANQGFGRFVTNEVGQWEHQVEQVPTAAAFQYAKEHLDGLIEKSLASPGEAKAARRYTNLKNALVDAIDRHPDQNVAGLWQAARQSWEEPAKKLSAFKSGQRLLTQNIKADDIPSIIEGFSPEETQHLYGGVRKYLEGTLNSNRKAARSSSRVLDRTLSPEGEAKIRGILPSDRADQLIDALRHEESMHDAPTRIFGGSPTAGRLAGKNRWETPEGVLEKVSLEHVTKPGKTIAKGLTKVGLNAMERRREAAASQLRQEAARALTTQGAERNSLARALIGAEEPGPGTWSRGATPGGAGERAPPAAGPAARPQPVYGGTAAGWRPVTPAEVATVRQGVGQAPRAAAAPTEAKGQSLFQFLRSKGGLKRTPDLEHTLDKRHSLFRSGGMSEEDAMTAAVEAGYLDTPEGIRGRGNIRDFHNAIREEAHGTKRYPVGGRYRTEEINPDENRHRIGQAVDDYFDEIGHTPSSSMLRDRVVELVGKEGLSLEAAHERAAMEEGNEFEEVPRGQGRVPVASGEASSAGIRGGTEGQRGQGQRASGAGKGDTEEIKRWVRNHQKKVERDDDVPFRRGGRVRRADGGDVNLSPDAQALSSTMTHYAEQPNPAAPYIQAAKDFAQGGLWQAMHLPENAVTRAMKSDAANAALGVMTPIKGTGVLMGAPEAAELRAARAAAANTDSARQAFIDEYDALVRKKAAEENRKDFRVVPQERASGGRVIGSGGQSEVGLAKNPTGVSFRCGTCKYFKKGVCHNANPVLKERPVKPHWCCSLYSRDGMEKIA